MNSGSDLDKCISLLVDFINDKLNGHLDKLKYYTFDDLFYEKNKKYGFNSFPDSIWEFDPDCSKISHAIYFLLWKDFLPEFSYDSIGINYRGDTLNTFNTLFGKNYHKAKSIIKNDDLFYKKVESFNDFYLSIGNFSLLPNEVPPGYTKRDSINCYRGKKWNDYYDRFLVELDKCLSSQNEADSYLCQLKKANAFYFSKFDTLSKYVQVNYLEPYLDSNGSIQKNRILEFNSCDLTSPNDYKYISIKYIDESVSIIESRADRIISKLKNYI